MPVVHKRPQAENDLLDIWDYIADENYSPDAASRFLRLIDEALERLAENPLMGTARPEINREARMFPVKKYLILYEPIEDGIDVVRIVRGSRDLGNISLDRIPWRDIIEP